MKNTIKALKALHDNRTARMSFDRRERTTRIERERGEALYRQLPLLQQELEVAIREDLDQLRRKMPVKRLAPSEFLDWLQEQLK